MAPRATKKLHSKQKQGHRVNHENKRNKQFNVAGFQKRMAQKPPKMSNKLDVYEYDDKQRKGKSRAAVTLDLSKEEAREFAIGDEEEVDDLERMRQKIRMGDDVEINSEDDEDIDSDDAFGTSDEERFADYNLKSNKKKTKAPIKVSFQSEIDLNEDEDESNDSEDEDEEDEDDNEDEPMQEIDRENDKEGSERSEPSSMDDMAGLQSSGDEEEPQEALEALENYISGLEVKSSSTKRKAPELDDEISAPPRQKRRILKEKTEAGVEGEFVSSTKQIGKLQLSDLIIPLATDSASVAVQSLQSAAKALNTSKAAPLAAPLPLRTQDRLDRQAAYEQTKAEVQKWEPTMRRIREADHLSFPLQIQPVPESNIAALASDFKPATKLESAVDRLLKAAELRDQDMAKTEELKMQHLTPEEIAERRAELRKARDLMFRAEIKAKRIAKIKSKTYRKIKKKEKTRHAEKLKEMGLEVDEEAERMETEANRARERATLKHKSTGKWAMNMKHRGELDEDQRQQMQEMYDRGEKLKRKIAGLGSDQDTDDNETDDSDNDSDAAASALRKLDELSRDEAGAKPKGGGLMEMQFMKRAELRDNAKTKGLVDSFKEELDKLGMAEDGDATTTAQAGSVVRMGGRVFYESGAKAGTAAFGENNDLSSGEDIRDSLPDLAQKGNPWLSVDKTSGKRSKAKNEIMLGKNSDAATLSKNAMKKRLRKQTDAVAQAKDDATLEIDINTVMTLPKDVAGKSRKNQVPQVTGGRDQVDKAYRDDDLEDEAEVTTHRQKKVAFEQRELVARAFAGDNVIEEFAAEKDREMEADAPKEVDTTLPGWGSWGGTGITRPPPKPERIKRFPGVDPRKRQDFGKDHVIISEKKDKKAEKYLVKDLPFPYTSKAQFERRLEVPLGMEWNTRATFQKATLPRVVKKMGTVIEPLERLF